MNMLTSDLTPDVWMRYLFSSKPALEGGVVRPKVADVTRIVGCARFEAEVRRRGFSMVRNGRYYAVFCNREGITLIE